MRIRVLFFAALREAIGKDSAEVELPDDIVITVAALRQQLAAQPGAVELATFRNLRCAVNSTMASFDTPLAEGDEVAFFPPVTGG